MASVVLVSLFAGGSIAATVAWALQYRKLLQERSAHTRTAAQLHSVAKEHADHKNRSKKQIEAIRDQVTECQAEAESIVSAVVESGLDSALPAIGDRLVAGLDSVLEKTANRESRTRGEGVPP